MDRKWSDALQKLIRKKAENPEEPIDDAVKPVATEMVKREVRKQVWSFVLSNLWWILPAVLAAYLLFCVFAAIVGDTTMQIPSSNVANYPGIESGVPAQFQFDLANASLTYHVPEQYLAAEIFTESDWDPAAYADYDDSHAEGLAQFEPGTWSGTGDPDQTLSLPDTDATRIGRYGGFGVDADGLRAPVGTSALEALHPKELFALSSSCSSQNTCAPYASPFDPADALMAAAKYLSFLRTLHANWIGAAEGYYGGAGAYTYAEKVLVVTYAYIKDFIPPVSHGGKYRMFGNFPVQTVHGFVRPVPPAKPIVGKKTIPLAMQNYKRQVAEDAWGQSVPLFSPESGEVRLRLHGARLQMRLPGGERVTMPTQDWMPWELNRGQRSAYLEAGEIVGFVNIDSGAVQVFR